MEHSEIEMEQRSIHKNVFFRLLKYAKPYWYYFAETFALVFIITALELYRPKLIGKVVDLFSTQVQFSEVRKIAIIYLIVLLASFVCNFLQTWILQLTGQTIIYNIRQEIFEHIHKLSLRFFDITPVGRIVTRVTNDVEALNEMYTSILVRLIKNIVKILGLIFVMLALDVKIALFSFLLLPFIIGLTILFKKISRATYRIARTKITAINTYLSEHLSGMKLIQIFAREKEKNAEFAKRNEELFRANYREMMVFAIFRPSIYMLSVIAMFIVLLLGGDSVLKGVITVGTLYQFTQYISSFFEPIQELAEQFGTLQSAMASAEKIFMILDEEPAIVNPKQPNYLPQVKGKIEFEHVWFAYQREDWILKDVSLSALTYFAASLIS